MKKTTMMIILLLLISIILVGCNTNKNQYGIKEKETDKYVELEENPYQTSGFKNYRYFNVNFLNSNISFDIYTEAGEFINTGSSVICNNFILSCNGDTKANLCWVGHSLSRFYIDIIIMENDNIIGYALIKIENNFGEYLHSIEKQVIFPDAINNEIKLSKEIVKILLSENKQYITDLNKIVEEETNEFVLFEEGNNFSNYMYDNNAGHFNIFSLNIKGQNLIYEIEIDKGKFSINSEPCVKKVTIDSSKHYSNNLVKVSAFWDENHLIHNGDAYEIPLTYIDIIVYENNIIKGYIVLKIEKYGMEEEYSNILYSTSIIKQVKFHQKSVYHDDDAYITREQVKQLIEKCKEGINEEK